MDMLPQSDLPSEEEHFVASGRQVIALVGVSNLEPGDLLGVAHAPLMSVPLDALQHVGRPSGHSSDLTGVTPVSAVTAPPLAAVDATASPSPALLERLNHGTARFIPARLGATAVISARCWFRPSRPRPGPFRNRAAG